ncbi:pituitary tumor-transforming gene 1 protein-interacting protein-like [Actinia tenebrosa]|uniref:Pituitary tumor-transforming gene 1 protein-interacting protein-like n=1 Tax=Actinia tenebrosa TaxID=6105 RepID=A0A6P8IZX6_ACTTE|nr:pituitary tumor-transforming gene 1 protein-interacting protein-like [Actinia tenebrosa]
MKEQRRRETSQQDMANIMNILLLFTATYLCFYCLSTVQAANKTLSADEECAKHTNGSCGDCVAVKGCYYCEPTKKCSYDVVNGAFHGACKDSQWKVGQCVLSGKILIIVLPSIAGAILIALCCLIYCCCCRKKKGHSKKESKEEARFRRQREEIDLKHSQRRAERQVKYDEIRKKYGLYKNTDEEPEDGKYHQFSNEA